MMLKVGNVPGWAWVSGGVALAGLALYAAMRKTETRADGTEKPLSESVAEGVAKAAGGVVVGAIKGVGALVGVPDTSAEKCSAAKATGSAWDVSLYCPASEAMGWMFGGDGAENQTESQPDSSAPAAKQKPAIEVVKGKVKPAANLPEWNGGGSILTGPTFEGGQNWASDSALYFVAPIDAAGRNLVNVAGIRG